MRQSPRILPLTKTVQNAMILPPAVLLGLVVIFAGIIVSSVEGQSPNGAQVTDGTNGIDIVANEPRPLKAVIISLTEHFGWVVDYEEPPYSKTSLDVSDLTDPHWKATHPNDTYSGLKGGWFHTHLTTSEAAAAQVPAAAIERIVTEYNEASLPGHFAVRTDSDGRLAVVGVATRDSSGAYGQSDVLLDSMLEMTPSTMSLQAALNYITEKLSKISGRHVVVGTTPLNLLDHTQCNLPSGSVNARSVLDQILQTAPMQMSYYLLYDPNDDLYVLNLAVVTRVIEDAHGANKAIVVRQRSN